MTTTDTASDLADVVRAHWTARVATFDSEPTHGLLTPAQRKAWFAAVARWAGQTPIEALDVGCATGFFTLILGELGHHVTAVDLTPAMVGRARRKVAEAGMVADIRVGDAAELPLPDRSIDLVVERHLMWTLPNPSAALVDWIRVTRPGGRIVMCGVDWREAVGSPTAGDYGAVRDTLPLYGGCRAGTYVELMMDAGLADIRVESLRDDVYWGDGRGRDRYAVIGTV